MQADNIQNILNRLYIEDSFRKLFFGDREQFVRDNKIMCTQTIDFLLQLKQNQVEFFAESLYQKRFYAASQLIPGTLFLLGKDHGSMFKKFSVSFHAKGIHKHHEDAFAYCNYVKENVKQNVLLKAMLRFESDLLLQFLKIKRWKISIYPYNLFDFRRHPARENLKKSFTIVAWRKGNVYRVLSF